MAKCLRTWVLDGERLFGGDLKIPKEPKVFNRHVVGNSRSLIAVLLVEAGRVSLLSSLLARQLVFAGRYVFRASRQCLKYRLNMRTSLWNIYISSWSVNLLDLVNVDTGFCFLANFTPSVSRWPCPQRFGEPQP